VDVVRSGITDNPGRSRGGEGRLQVGRRFQGAGLMVIRSAAVKMRGGQGGAQQQTRARRCVRERWRRADGDAR
jgi:hypothetical protein